MPFLHHYAQHGLKATAAKAVGVTAYQIDKFAENCIEFETSLRETEELVADRIEAEVYRRAVDGIDKNIYYQGDICGTETQYSDALLQTLIKAKRRKQFGDKTELTGAGGGALQIFIRAFDAPDAQLPALEHTPTVLECDIDELA